MRRLLVILLSLLFLAGCTSKESEPEKKPDVPPVTPEGRDTISTKRDLEYLFDVKSLPTIKMTVTEADWNEFLTNFDYYPDNRLYIPAKWSFTKNGKTFLRDSVGLRLRGNTSRRRPESSKGEKHKDGAQWHHSHFGINFVKYTTGERFFGCDKMVLKYSKEDPTYVHEVFSYNILKGFGVWVAPYASYCRLSIYVEGDTKPVYLGVYIMNENPRKGWIADRHAKGFLPDKDGHMWKTNNGADLAQPYTSLMGISDDYGYVNPLYDYKSKKDELNDAKLELLHFMQGMMNCNYGSASLKAWIEENIEIDQFLRTLACDVMVGQWDNYWGNLNNYQFYFDSNHKFYYIPYDYDNTLGTGWLGFVNPGNGDVKKWGPRDDTRMLVAKVLSIKEFEERYLKYINDLTAVGFIDPETAMQQVTKFQALVRPYVSNDTGEDCTIYDHPAVWWGDFMNYKLLSGTISDGISEPTNFFKTKVASVKFD